MVGIDSHGDLGFASPVLEGHFKTFVWLKTYRVLFGGRGAILQVSFGSLFRNWLPSCSQEPERRNGGYWRKPGTSRVSPLVWLPS